MGQTILTEIISLLVGGISGIATGIGQGLSTLAQSVFLQTVEGVTSLSTFGIIVCVFAGVSLAISLSRLVVRWVSTLGSRKP